MVSYRVSLYPPFPSNCLGCMAPSVIKNKGTPQMSSLEVLKRERKYNLSKWPNFQIRSSVQQMNPIYDSSIPCLNYHCIIVTEINIIVLYIDFNTWPTQTLQIIRIPLLYVGWIKNKFLLSYFLDNFWPNRPYWVLKRQTVEVNVVGSFFFKNCSWPIIYWASTIW